MNEIMEDTEEILSFKYNFIFNNGENKEFLVFLNNRTLDLIPSGTIDYQDWMLLEKFRCPNCTLPAEKNRYCPVAANLFEVINTFKGKISHEEIELIIETKERKYFKKTTLQVGLSSLIGIFMVTGSCPVLEKLKPMVRYHLPFASLEETRYRVISMYVLAQYLRMKKGLEYDFELTGLSRIYDEIKIINKNFCEKLNELDVEDASINALVILDTFAESVTVTINSDILQEMALLFEPYLRT